MLHYARGARYIPASLSCGGVNSVGWKKEKELMKTIHSQLRLWVCSRIFW